MNRKELKAFAKEAAKSIKSEADFNDFRKMLTKVTVEAALNAELDEYLGYARHQSSEVDNYRNGSTPKTLRTEDGEIEIDTPRDRNSSFEPALVKNEIVDTHPKFEMKTDGFPEQLKGSFVTDWSWSYWLFMKSIGFG